MISFLYQYWQQISLYIFTCILYTTTYLKIENETFHLQDDFNDNDGNEMSHNLF